MKFKKPIIFTSILAVISLGLIALVIYSQQHILSSHEKSLPLIKLGEHIKSTTSRAHLWLEEALAGDKTVDFNTQVIAPLYEDQNILDAAYQGKSTSIGTMGELDDDTRAIIKEGSIAVEELKNSATELWNAHQANLTKTTDTAGGVAMDTLAVSLKEQQFDEHFESLQKQMDKLVAHVNEQVKKQNDNLSAIAWLTSFVVMVVLVIGCLLFYALQRQNIQTIAENERKLDAETKRVGTLSQFIEAVSAGNYNIELEANEEDALISTLISMRDKLKKNTDDDYKRNWTTTGLARIGEILRATNTNSSELYDNIIQFIVKYTKSNQGGMFIVTQDEDSGKTYLELVSSYAFERKKYLQKRLEPGDGLVGQTYLEGEKIYLTEVPENYVTITSGLGGTTPKSVLLIPMKVNDKTFGVIEIASFNKYQDYEIELLEKLAESVASTISNVRVNETTRILLEKTQQQAEEMKSQEEEIRQNMEELEATQEEMRRKQTALERELAQSQQQAAALKVQEAQLTQSQDTLQAIVDNIPRAIFWKDNDLRFMGCNIIFAQIAGLESTTDLIGKTDFDMAWSAQADAYRKDDYEVMRSRRAKLDIEEVNINSAGEESWVRTSKVPIISKKGEVVAILGMFEDITVWKRKEADTAQKLRERDELVKELQQLREIMNPSLKRK